MSRRYIVLAVISILLALGCFRLSKWQVDRLAQRRSRNALLAERLATPPAPLSAIPADTAQGHYRRVRVQGVFDYDRELALALRSRDGSPGVYILTPMRLSDGTTVLTNRGWVYAADGMNVDFARWREGNSGDSRYSATVEGFLETYVASRGPVTLAGRP
ncbi:MAG TPA: SURF1 family protein, partial [Gemmatimonadaceae bacterium]|nr:SURF1 family protein [Gemmatimonadaceae bacterium]